MRQKRSWRLYVLLLALALLTTIYAEQRSGRSAAPQPSGAVNSEQNTSVDKPPVTILDDFGKVDKQAVHISKSKKEEVVWINKADHDITVEFSEAPFDWKEPFVVHGKGQKSSGPAKDTAQDDGHAYKYTVTGAKGKNDPIVIIDK